MGEIIGAFVGGWLWVALGRLVARRGRSGRVLTAALVALVAMIALMAFSHSQGTPGEQVSRYATGHIISVTFWLWRFSTQVAKDEAEDASKKG